MKIKKIKKLFFDLISFNNPKSIVINLSFIFLILIVVPTQNLNWLPARSLYSEIIIPTFFGSCPSEGIFKNCGFYSIGQTRAMSNLLHLNFEEAFKQNYLVVLLFLAMLTVLIINIFKIFRNNK